MQERSHTHTVWCSHQQMLLLSKGLLPSNASFQVCRSKTSSSKPQRPKPVKTLQRVFTEYLHSTEQCTSYPHLRSTANHRGQKLNSRQIHTALHTWCEAPHSDYRTHPNTQLLSHTPTHSSQDRPGSFISVLILRDSSSPEAGPALTV